MSQSYTVSVLYGMKLSPDQFEQLDDRLGELSVQEWADNNDFDLLVDTYDEAADIYFGYLLARAEEPELKVVGIMRSVDYGLLFQKIRTTFHNLFRDIEDGLPDLYVISRVE